MERLRVLYEQIEESRRLMLSETAPNLRLAYATLMFILGLTEQFADIADARNDTTGLPLEDERLPERIRK